MRNAQSAGASALATTAGGFPGPAFIRAQITGREERGENGHGYGSNSQPFPDEALPRLIATEKENLLERELLTGDLIKELQLVSDEKVNASETKLIEVLRDPRIRGERFQQLQREAKREVDTLASVASVPLQQRRSGNPALCESLRRGIKHKG